jgi:hypothetical protein
MDRLLVQSYVVHDLTTLLYCTATRKYARSISVFKSVPTHLLGCTLPFSRDTGRYSRHLGILFISQANSRTKGKPGYGHRLCRIPVKVREKSMVHLTVDSRFPLFRPVIEMIKIGTNCYPTSASTESTVRGTEDAIHTTRCLTKSPATTKRSVSGSGVSSLAHGPGSLRSTTFGVGERQTCGSKLVRPRRRMDCSL